jgi:hypothetical protein
MKKLPNQNCSLSTDRLSTFTQATKDFTREHSMQKFRTENLQGELFAETAHEKWLKYPRRQIMFSEMK